MDFGYFLAHAQGMDPQKLEQVPTWRTSDAFTPVERRVMEFAEAATATPPAVTDEMAQALRTDLGEDGLVELTNQNLKTGDIAYEGIPGQKQP